MEDVIYLPFKGGSILGTSRTNPTKSPEDMKNVLDVLRKLGDRRPGHHRRRRHRLLRPARSTSRPAGRIRVAHVPKTIDNDLPLPGSTPTFGFETARQLGVGIVRNLAEDARTTSRWYLIVSMGRAAGHLALGIGKAAAATLTIIPEEFRGREVTLDELCDIIIGSIIKRRRAGRQLRRRRAGRGADRGHRREGPGRGRWTAGSSAATATSTRDPHGHLRLGEIEFGRMIKDRLTRTARSRWSLKTTFIDKDLGYELRCADPIPFDAEYTRDLGYGAVKFLRSKQAAEVRRDHQLRRGAHGAAAVREDDRPEDASA